MKHLRICTLLLTLGSGILCSVDASAQSLKETGTCSEKKTVVTTTRYYTNAFKVVYTLFGLFASTQSCYTEEQVTYSYEYIGPGTPAGPADATGNSPGISFRLMTGESTCYGAPIVPTGEMKLEVLKIAALNGQVVDLAFTPTQGNLQHFLGANADLSPFDPAFHSSTTWTGSEAFVPRSLLLAPTLQVDPGANPKNEVSAMMDVSNPAAIQLNADLGADSAGMWVLLATSSTGPGFGPLLNLNGIDIPIVPDWFTTAFSGIYSPFVGVADANGKISFDFPALAGTVLDSIDVRAAVAAFNPATGQVVDASTFVTIELRDLGQCQ